MFRPIRRLLITFSAGFLVGAAAVLWVVRRAPTPATPGPPDPAELALAKTVARLRIDETGLPAALRAISEQWNIPIQFDELPSRANDRIFSIVHVDQDDEGKATSSPDRISIHANDITLADALHWALQSDNRYCGYEVRNGIIRVSRDTDAFVRAYDVHDLMPARPAEPTNTPGGGGSGGGAVFGYSGALSHQPFSLTPGTSELNAIEVLTNSNAGVVDGVSRIGRTLVVYDTWDGHRQIVRLLDRLRHPQPIPTSAENAPEIRVWDAGRGIFVCPDPVDKALSRQLLTRVGPLHFRDIAIEDAIAALRDRWKVTIFVDRPEIDRANAGWNDRVTADLENPTLLEAIRVVLGDYGVAHRLGVYANDDVLVVTSEAHAYQGIATRIYSLGDWVSRIQPAALLRENAPGDAEPANPVDRLIAYLNADVDYGNSSTRDARITEFRGRLIVTQTWRNLEEIERSLSRLRALTEDGSDTGAKAK